MNEFMTRPTYILRFFVPGDPTPKQSFVMGSDGTGYTKTQIREWECSVRILGCNAMALQDQVVTSQPVRVTLEFYLPDHKRRDIDNLTKAVLDGLKGAAFSDDDQVDELNVRKLYLPELLPDQGLSAGVTIFIQELRRR